MSHIEAFTAVLAGLLTLFVFLGRQRQSSQWAAGMEKLGQSWGLPQARDRDFETLAMFYRSCQPPTSFSQDDFIDDQTWSDLNLAEVYAQVDRTVSTAGECILYRALRSPILAAETRCKRGRLIQCLQDDAHLRQTLQDALLRAGRGCGADLVRLVCTEPPRPLASIWVFRGLTAALAVSLAGEVLTRSLGWFIAILALCVVNAHLHFSETSRLEGRLGGLRPLGQLIAAARRIAAIPHPEFAEHAAALARATAATRPLARDIAWLPGPLTGALMNLGLDYLNIVFLQEVRIYNTSLPKLAARREELREIFALVGELDAWQSVGSYRAGLASYTEPRFTEDGPALAIENARHPLLEKPVPNSLTLQTPGIAITGSNMSGKTTFLRTIAVNALLAQTIATCLASSYCGQTLRIVSSMDETDDLLAGKSYYLSEAERLLKIVHLAEGEKPVLALIDEPLSGTNSPERLALSREILRFLAGHNGRVIVSTHDVELVNDLRSEGHFDAYHFADTADALGIRFDYRLRAGVDYHANAIKVLRYLGYPETILSAAQEGMGENGRSR